MEEGVGHLCYISRNTTFIKHKVEKQITKKNNYNNEYDKQLNSFYEQCSQLVLQHVDLKSIKCLIIASPGFVKDEFYKVYRKGLQ